MGRMPQGRNVTPRDEGEGERGRLARKVIALARGEVMADHQFLSGAVGLLEVRLCRQDRKFSTDGITLWADPDLVLADFLRTRQPPTHDLVHVLLHCLLLHPFEGQEEGIDRDAWALATDVVVERLAAEMLGPREGERGRAIGMVVEQLREDLGAEPTVERVYRALRRGRYHNVRLTWAKVLSVDDPRRWFPEQAERGQEEGEGSEDERGSRQRTSAGDDGGTGSDHAAPDEGAKGEGAGAHSGGGSYRDGLAGAEAGSAVEDASGDYDPTQDSARRVRARQRDEAKERWRRAARSMRVDLETISRAQGEQLGDLRRELTVGGRHHRDLREFLRRFSVMQENLRVSPDEFDYVFYAYGLSLYGNLPLIEQLEYREERTIRDFVIVIDTSGSVEGPAVQAFVNTAFDVLTQEGAFADRSVVHVIQADAGVQEDVRIASRDDLERWRRGFELKGLGGTDFRPAFAHVDHLIEEGELHDLAGLLYLTDGWGVFPSHPPRYKTAFVLYDGDDLPERMPPWAIRYVLSPDDLMTPRQG